MNGSIIDTAFLVNSLARKTSPPSTPGFAQKITEEGSFLGCLLSAIGGGEGETAFSGAIQVLSELSQKITSEVSQETTSEISQAVTSGVSQETTSEISQTITSEITWSPLANRLGSILGNGVAKENTETRPPGNALEEILGSLSKVGEDNKQPGLLVQMLKEKRSDQETVAREMGRTDTGNKVALLTNPKGTQGGAHVQATVAEAPMNETEKALFPEGFGQVPSESGKNLHEEVLSKTLQDLGRRLQTNEGKTGSAQQLQRTGLTDGLIHEAKSKEGMTQLISRDEDSFHGPSVDPSAMGEGVVTKARPVPVFATDGLMEQVLQTLNLRTWKVGQRELRIQLQPPELGRLHMKIGLEDHQVVLKIHVENPFVKDLIENNLAQLRQSLQDQGLRMDKCAVTVGDHFQHEYSGNGDHSLDLSEDYAVALNEGEIEESPGERAHSAYWGSSDLVNVFI
jgi:flagellar hook-length control protein FliK